MGQTVFTALWHPALANRSSTAVQTGVPDIRKALKKLWPYAVALSTSE
jgi:hypothetical protein